MGLERHIIRDAEGEVVKSYSFIQRYSNWYNYEGCITVNGVIEHYYTIKE